MIIKATISQALIVLLFFSSSCNIGDKYRWRNRAVKHYTEHINYDLLRPVAKLKLDEDLTEISGLTHISDNKIACIEDESGKIYFLDDATGEILDTEKFHKYGDYEGIAKVEDAYYIVKSNSKLYKYSDGETLKFKTPLDVKNNVEGLCFDEEENRLLMVCKELPGIAEDDFLGNKAIYAFDLNSNTLVEKPAYLIDETKVLDYVKSKWGLGADIKDIPFKPSGIAIQPKTKRIFIINYIGRLLIVLNRDGSIHTILPLSIQQHSQPEGICFDEEMNLYISNEGGEGNAHIYKYNYRELD